MSPPNDASSQTWRLLIVDDSPDDRAEVRSLLLRGSDRRYAFAEAETARAAKDAVLQSPDGPPTCVVLDHHLPDGTAPELLLATAGADGLGVCPVVVLTASDDYEVARSALRAGAQDFVGKGWMTPASLTRAVENAVERWWMARALAENEARLRMALAASHTGLWTWDGATNAVIWSPETHEIFGIPNGTFAGTGDAFYASVHPKDLPAVQARITEAIATRGFIHSEFRIVRGEGELRWVELCGRCQTDRHGATAQMSGTVTDITARKRVEIAAQASEQRLQATADSLPQLVWRSSRNDEEVEYFNARIAEYRGVERLPDGRWRWMAIVHPDDRPGTIAALRSTWSTGEASVCEHRLQMADGSFRWHLSRASPFTDSDGHVTWYGTSTDIHDRKVAEARLAAALDEAQRAVEARDRLVSWVSHDLRNPLGAVMMGMEMLQHHLGRGPSLSDERVATTLARINRQTKKMERLIGELLDVSWLQSNKPLQLERTRIELGALVRLLVEEHQHRAQRHRLTMRLAEEQVTGTWDALRIERVINNLLSNAIKYSPTGGEVEVMLDSVRDRDEAWAVVQVTDHGIGIPPEDQERVFAWFERGENAQTSTIPGNGIGLAASHAIVAQHGGSISFTSEVGVGTTFVLRLPQQTEPWDFRVIEPLPNPA